MITKLITTLINFIKSHIKTVLLYSVLFFIFVFVYIGVCNNYSFYDTTIAKVTSVNTKVTTSQGEKKYTQTIYATIKNGQYKNETINLTNTYSQSLVYTEKFYKGNDLFISAKHKDNNLTGTILGLKRDKSIVLILLIVIYLLLVFCKSRGFLSVFSLIINIVIFSIALKLYSDGYNLLLICSLAMILFSTITLIIINGFNRKTLASVISTITCIFIIALLSTLYILKNNSIDYEFMDFMYFGYEQYDANMIFISEIMLCGLGAIMDISITMSSSVNELITNTPEINNKTIYNSCKKIGNDILGTMINVMFFSNMAGCIPFMILSMKNGVSLISLLRYNCYFEIARCLTGSIGIVLAIPISTFFAIKIISRKEKSK